jgi:plasmid stabilization system protein ParE
MTVGQGFRLHPQAARDVTEIWGYIAQDSPVVAGRVRERILETIRELIAFPNQGHERPDLTSRPLRFKAAWDYLIAYVPDERPLLVLAVLHGRRHPRVIAAILRGRSIKS